MIEQEKDLICVGKHQNESIIAVLSDDAQQINQRLICAKCIDDKNEIGKVISFRNLRKNIEQRRERLYTDSESIITILTQHIDQFKQSLNETKNNMLTIINGINKKTEEWKQALQQHTSNLQQYSLLEELTKGDYSFTENIKEIKNLNQAFFLQTQEKIEQLAKFDNYSEQFYKIFLNSATKFQYQSLKILSKKENIQFHSQLICPQHKLQIKYIELKPNTRYYYYCDSCLGNKDVSITKFAEQWSEFIVEKSQYLQHLRFYQFDDLTQNLKEFQNQWEKIKFFNNLTQIEDIQMRFPENLDQLHTIITEYRQYQETFRFKPEAAYVSEKKSLQLEILQCGKEIIELLRSTTKSLKNQLIWDQQKIPYKNISQTRTNRYIKTIAFNYNSTYMIAGTIDDQIQIYQFSQGSLSFYQSLKHPTNITCIVCSKKTNWFVSASYEQTIRLWKENQSGEWLYQENKNHQAEITALLLTGNEKEVISCSSDKTINIYSVDSKEEKLTYIYNLKQHQDSIYCMDINKDDTTLVSCSRSSEIIVWKRTQDRKWTFYQSLSSERYNGQNILFLNLNRFVFSGIIYELEDGKYQESIIKPWTDHLWKQISIFNNQRNIFILSDEESVKVYKIYGNAICQKISFILESLHMIGNLTCDGKYLVIWTKSDSKLNVFELAYEGY